MKPPAISLVLLLQFIQQFKLIYTEERSTTCTARVEHLQATNTLNFSCLNNIVDLRDVNILFLQNSKLLTLPEDAFRLFMDASEIHLNGSTVQEIQSNAFARNGKLQKLYLNKNKISKLETDCFNFLDKLKLLDLSRNYLGSLKSTTFHNLKSLQVLNLSYNHLEDVSALDLPFTGSLEILDLSYNSLKEILPSLLPDFINLKRLFYNNNKIKHFALEDNYYKMVELVDVSFNQINYISTPDFKEFNINNNRLDVKMNLGDGVIHISFNNLPGFTIISPETRFLNASWNRIPDLSSKNFQYARDLKVVDVSHNHIAIINLNTFDHLFNLEHLNISHNLLTAVEYGTFDKLSNLETLDLSHNRFKFLYVNPNENVFEFRLLSRLYKVKVNNNPWSDNILDIIKTLGDIYSNLDEVSTTTENILLTDCRSSTTENVCLTDCVTKESDFINSESIALEKLAFKTWFLCYLLMIFYAYL